MKSVVYIGKNPEHSSMYLVGKQISDAIASPLASKAADCKGADLVVCCVVEDVGKLLEAKRFVGFKSLVVFFAPNAEEFSDTELCSLLVRVCTGEVSKLVVHSKHTYAKLEEVWLKFLSPKWFRDLHDKVRVCLWGVSSEFIFRTTGRDKYVWLAPFNRVNKTQKNLDLHARLSSLIKAKGGKTLFIFGGMTSGVEIPEVYEVVPQGTREEYLQTISEVGLSLCVSNFESFGIYYLELMSSGIPVLFLDKPWVRKLLPSYPLVFDLETLETLCVTFESQYPFFVSALTEYVSSEEFKRFEWGNVVSRIKEAL